MSDSRPHPLAGCRRRHELGEPCQAGCVCDCHGALRRFIATNADRCSACGKVVTQPHDCPWRRGRERAVAEMAALPPDDGTVTVSVPDASKTTRTHFKLCSTCGWPPGSERCQCAVVTG